jgi:hypothetical protein
MGKPASTPEYDPQEGLPRDRWMSHDGIVWIEDMSDEYLLNCYKTAERHGNPKADDLMREIEDRQLDWRL